MQKYIISGIILIMLVVIFALQNAGPVLVNFYFWDFHIPTALLIIGSASLGFISGMIFSRISKKEKKDASSAAEESFS
jgi:uncharacterized integral membrane protein